MPLALTPTLESAASGLPRVRLDVTTLADDAHVIYRIEPDASLVPVRTADPVTPVVGVSIVYDYEAPFDASVSYRIVRSLDSTSADSAPVTVPSGGVPWLIHPGNPEVYSIPLVVEEWPAWSRPAVRGLYQIIGRSEPIAVGMKRGGESGTLTAFTDGPTDRTKMLAILADGTSLLLNGSTVDGAGSRWVSVGDLGEEPQETYLPGFVRWVLPLDVVAAPTGFALAAISYSAASAEWVTYAAMNSVLTNYAELSAGEWV